MIKRKIAVCIGACCLLSGIALGQSKNEHKNVYVPVRMALVPGLSTQGKKDVNTTSNFSFNVLGGITGSVNGLEFAGLFSMDKGNLQGVQYTGLFNMTEGFVNGIQLAGWFNVAKGQVTGLQYSGLTNYAGKNVNGLQMSGLYNQTSGSINGAQIGGLANYTKQDVKGLQMAGIANINNGNTTGFQLAGIFNYTKHLKGLQMGLINVADTSDGFSIGFITIVHKGYHKITVSSNEVLNANLAVKTGNAKLYNILLVGVNAGNDNKCFSYGYGIGHEIKLGSRFTVNPEITTQHLYLGSWHYTNILSKLQLQATVKLAPGIAIFAGPSFAVYYSDQPAAEKGYKFKLPSNNYHSFELWNDKVNGWIGWTAGISFL